jgi:putative Mn2+ efflux pump MntP
MGLFELIMVAIAVSMDAFAIAICKGLSVEKVEKKHLISAGLWFGGAQAIMPLIGYLLGTTFKDFIESVDHWISFVFLAVIGINMIFESFKKAERLDSSFSPKAMFPLAIADSIDALAVGVAFAFLEVNIILAILLIGFTTFWFSFVGVKIGNCFGAKHKSKAEFVGGLILIVMGVSILTQHLGLI